MERRLTPRGEDRRRQLIAYAARRFAEGGYHPTSVSEIVQGIGVGKGVFYWYFTSKEELLAEILREAQLSLRKAQQAEIADETDPIRRIEHGIRASMRWLDANRHLDTLMQFARTEQQFHPVMANGGRTAVTDVVRHLTQAIEDGRIPPADPEVLAHCVLGVTNSLARVQLIERGADPDAVADAAITFVREGIAASPAPV